MRTGPVRDSSEIPAECLIYKLQLSMYEHNMLDPEQENVSIESYLSDNNRYFSALYIQSKTNKKISAINLYIDKDASEAEVSEFQKLIFREEIMKKIIPEMFFLNVQSEFADSCLEQFVSLLGGSHLLDTNYNLYFAQSQENKKEERPLPEGYRFGALSEENLEHMARCWAQDLGMHKVGDLNITLDMSFGHILKNNMTWRPYSALFYQDEQKPVAWVLTYADGELGSLHVAEQHRRKGLARILVRELYSNIKGKHGIEPHALIEDKNVASASLFESEGWVRHGYNFKKKFLPNTNRV